MKIFLVDEIMSSGKSHWMLEQMKQWYANKDYDQFVYLSPLLSEVGGVKNDIGMGYLGGRIQSHLPEMGFKYPIPINGSKSKNIRILIHQCKNISATHNLFLGMDKECIPLLEQNKNVLVIDECLEAYRVFDGITKKSLDALIRAGMFYYSEDDYVIHYNHEQFPLHLNEKFEFRELVSLCDTGCVFFVDGNVLVWEFPVEILKAFDDIWVLSYLFEGSFMSAWCKINDVEVVRVRPSLNRTTKEVKDYIRDCIELYEKPDIKKIENYSFSQYWWNDSVVSSVADEISGFLENAIRKLPCKAEDILITCPKLNWEHSDNPKDKKRPLIKGKGYSSATWLYSDARATNDFADKNTLIYLLGKHPNPLLIHFCSSRGIEFDKDKYALANLLQWIFRGSVRKKEKMYLILPNKRMRDLFKEWLKDEE